MILFLKNLVPDIPTYHEYCNNPHLVRILSEYIYHHRSREIPKCHEYGTPECRSGEGDKDKWYDRHTENPSGNRYEMSHYWYETTDERIESIIREK